MPRLRVRSSDGSTLRLEVPRDCNLGVLKELIRQQLGLRDDAAALKLSLNGRAELSGSNEDPIAAAGICSGDLVHLMGAPSARAEPAADLSPDSKRSRHAPAPQNATAHLSSDLVDRPASLGVAATAPFQQESSAPAAQNGAGPSSQQMGAATAVPARELSSQPADVEMDEAPELDDEALQQKLSLAAPSFPDSLRSCLQVAGLLQSAAQLLLLAAHSALLEAGLHLMQGEPNCAKPRAVTLLYCLTSHSLTAEPAQCTVKANLLGGTHLVVAGMATASQVHKLILSLHQLVDADKISSLVGAEGVQAFRQLPGLWRQLKDELAHPLKAGLCTAEGVEPPASLLMLPVEVKQRCFQNLQAKDLATLCKVCRELRDVASSDLLWRSRFEGEFGSAASYEAEEARRLGWQAVFGTKWACRERMRRQMQEHRRRLFGGVPFPGARGPNIPLPQPGVPINGGDFDRLPAPFLGMPGTTGGPLGMSGIGVGPDGAGFRLPGGGFGQPPGSHPFQRSRDAARWRLH